MPIYEYTCQKCGAQMEVMQKMSDVPLAKHPKCGGKLEKQWSQTSFQLKGSGWYVTDYAAKKSDGGAEAKADGADAKADGADKKTDGDGVTEKKPEKVEAATGGDKKTGKEPKETKASKENSAPKPAATSSSSSSSSAETKSHNKK